MEILVLGGTRFVGRRIVEALAADGHRLTLVNRGMSGPPPVDEVEVLLADRGTPDLADVLAGRQWDVTVDVCAYTSDDVESLAAALDGRGGHHVFISTISVYDEVPAGAAIDEDSPRLAPLPGREEHRDLDPAAVYGGRKAACEDVARERYGQLTIVRPGIVAGAHDPTGRFTTWVERALHAGPEDVLAVPASPDDPMELIDARDLAAFVAGLVRTGTAGTFNATGAAGTTLGTVAQACVDATGTPARFEWRGAGADALEWPLTYGPEDGAEAFFSIEPARALAAGLVHRPLVDTATDVAQELRVAAGSL